MYFSARFLLLGYTLTLCRLLALFEIAPLATRKPFLCNNCDIAGTLAAVFWSSSKFSWVSLFVTSGTTRGGVGGGGVDRSEAAVRHGYGKGFLQTANTLVRQSYVV